MAPAGWKLSAGHLCEEGQELGLVLPHVINGALPQLHVPVGCALCSALDGTLQPQLVLDRSVHAVAVRLRSHSPMDSGHGSCQATQADRGNPGLAV